MIITIKSMNDRVQTLEDIDSDVGLNREKGLCYLSIPKCATQSMWPMTAAMGFKSISEYALKELYIPMNYFAIIREPVSRWVSGLAQFMADTAREGTLQWNFAVSDIFEQKDFFDQLFVECIFDQHTIPQTKYLEHYRESIGKPVVIKLFPLEQLDLMFVWLEEHGIQTPDMIHTHKSSDQSVKAVFCKRMHDFLHGNPEYVNKIRVFYKLDVEMYNIMMRSYKKDMELREVVCW